MGIPGIGGGSPIDPSHQRSIGATQIQEIADALKFANDAYDKSKSNNNIISIRQCDDLMNSMQKIIKDPDMPQNIRDEAQSLIHYIRRNAVPWGEGIKLEPFYLEHVKAPLEYLYKRVS